MKCRLAMYYRIPGHTGDRGLPSLSPAVVTWPVVDSGTSAGQEIFTADSLESCQHPGGSLALAVATPLAAFHCTTTRHRSPLSGYTVGPNLTITYNW